MSWCEVAYRNRTTSTLLSPIEAPPPTGLAIGVACPWCMRLKELSDAVLDSIPVVGDRKGRADGPDDTGIAMAVDDSGRAGSSLSDEAMLILRLLPATFIFESP